MTVYSLCGWRVASEMPLPDLMPWTEGDCNAELTVRLGAVLPLTDPVDDGPLLQIGADGTCRFAMAGVAAFRVDAEGREITVEPYAAIDAPDIRAFLFGTVFAIVCFHRKLLPLHASAVRIGGKAIAFSGPSGCGKSTLAASFFKRGYAVVSDDVAVIEPDAPGGPRLLPAFPRLKLWRDVMNGFGFGTAGLEHTHGELDKFHLPVNETFTAESLPLAAVYHLDEAREPQQEEVKPLHGVDAFLAMERGVYRRNLGHKIMGAPEMFALSSKVAATVASARLVRRISLARAGEIVEAMAASAP
jgi:Serine kinase of the HPr protein, regulates carbohydrate metabolism